MQDQWRHIGLLVLRLGFAGMMALGHGYGKLTDLLNGSTNFPDPLGVGTTLSLGLATFGEFVCCLAVAAGVYTKITVIPPILTMSLAAFIVHRGDSMEQRELALLYLIAFLVILSQGPGRYSVDGFLARRKGQGSSF